MSLWQNIPFFLILLPLASASFTSVLPPRYAKRTLILVESVCLLLSAAFLCLMLQYQGSFRYALGTVGAPVGNELRAGPLEALMAFFFILVALSCILGGRERADVQLAQQRQSLYCTVIELMTAAVMVMTFSNDLFTCYVFIEIMTISGCALIAVRSRSKSVMASARYMIMNLLGSGMFLLGLSMLYCLTGHLLMENINDSIAQMFAQGVYKTQLIMVIGLIIVGLSVKGALFPFHTWLPDAYATSTLTSSALLCSVISKAYLFLILKVIYRVIGQDILLKSGVNHILFILSIASILIGSLDALREHRLRRMVAYSSVAQIGYVFLGLSMGTQAGAAAAVYQMLAHMITKPMLFIASDKLVGAAGGSDRFHDLRGAAKRVPLAGAAFTMGALSMVGIPMFSGFMSKVYLGSSAMAMSPTKAFIALGALALSTAMNTAYFLKTVITLYRTEALDGKKPAMRVYESALFAVPVLLLAILSLLLGFFCTPVRNQIITGLSLFS